MNRRELIASFVAAAIAPAALAKLPSCTPARASYLGKVQGRNVWVGADLSAGQSYSSWSKVWWENGTLQVQHIDPSEIYAPQPSGVSFMYDEYGTMPPDVWGNLRAGEIGRYEGFKYLEMEPQPVIDQWRQWARGFLR